MHVVRNGRASAFLILGPSAGRALPEKRSRRHRRTGRRDHSGGGGRGSGRRCTKDESEAVTAAAKVTINALQEAIEDLWAVPPANSHIPPMTKA